MWYKKVLSSNQLGEVIPVNRVKPMTLPFYDVNVKIVVGFPIPLNNHELAQDIVVLKTLWKIPMQHI